MDGKIRLIVKVKAKKMHGPNLKSIVVVGGLILGS